MTKVQLKAQLRGQADGQAKVIRKSGFIPAVVYGAGVATKSIKIKNHDFERAFRVAGEFNLLDLFIGESKPLKVIVKDVQHDNLSGKIIHIDFYQVNMSKEIITEIPLHFIGESRAIKDLGGTLVRNMDTVKVSCLPGDLANYIEVDISKLDNFGQFIRLHDLTLPPGVKLVSVTDEVVVGAAETKVEMEAPKPAEAPLSGAEGAPATEGQVAGQGAAEAKEGPKPEIGSTGKSAEAKK
jgi:large subunit ribosomal protein L25